MNQNYLFSDIYLEEKEKKTKVWAPNGCLLSSNAQLCALWPLHNLRRYLSLANINWDWNFFLNLKNSKMKFLNFISKWNRCILHRFDFDIFSSIEDLSQSNIRPYTISYEYSRKQRIIIWMKSNCVVRILRKPKKLFMHVFYDDKALRCIHSKRSTWNSNTDSVKCYFVYAFVRLHSSEYLVWNIWFYSRTVYHYDKIGWFQWKHVR